MQSRPPRRPRGAEKLRLLRLARLLRHGRLVAHNTATLPGVAAHPESPVAIRRLQRFKQRRGPFLLLADSAASAAAICRWLSPMLRRAMRTCWPGRTTLIVSSRPRLPDSCRARGQTAVRVDASPAARYLAYLCGGLIISSSLNRSGQPPTRPSHTLRMRWRHHLSACDAGGMADGRPSTLLRLSGTRHERLR